MERKKKDKILVLVTIFICVFAMTVVVIAALLVYDKVKSREKDDVLETIGGNTAITYSEQEVNAMLTAAVDTAKEQAKLEGADEILSALQGGLAEGNSVVATLRPLFPNDIVVVSNGSFHFVPIQDNLKKHNRIQENLQILESGEFQYVEAGQVISHKGIDVSKFQGKIDWKRVAEDGVEYAFIRLGNRGYGQEGKLVLDEKFEDNIKGAKAAGIKVGIYFFSQAINEAEAIEEAEFVLEHISPYKIDYPIVLDVEKVSASTGRMNQLSVEERTNVALTFLQKIKESGYTPMIYANMEMLSVLIDIESFEEYDKWFAYYDSKLYFPYEHAVWQYSEKGKVDGISTDVDLNISFKEWN